MEHAKRAYVVPVIILFVLIFSGLPTLGAAQQGQIPLGEETGDMVLTGVFHPYSENLPKGQIPVQIGQKKWAFEVKQFMPVTGTGGDTGGGEMYHAHKALSSLRLIGPKKLLNPLLNEDLNGKNYSFIGNFYDPDNIMVVKTARQIAGPTK